MKLYDEDESFAEGDVDLAELDEETLLGLGGLQSQIDFITSIKNPMAALQAAEEFVRNLNG